MLVCVYASQEHWYMSYIDLLQRFELWNVSNEVIKLSTCSAITCLNQASTTLHINCSNCKRPMSNKGWICDRYSRLTHTHTNNLKHKISTLLGAY